MRAWLRNPFSGGLGGAFALLVPIIAIAIIVGRTYFVQKKTFNGWKGWEGFFDLLWQLGFNLAGALGGWVLLWAGIIRSSREPGLAALGWVDLLLFLFAFIGICGYLPETARGLVSSVGRLVEGAAEKIVAKPKEQPKEQPKE